MAVEGKRANLADTRHKTASSARNKKRIATKLTLQFKILFYISAEY